MNVDRESMIDASRQYEKIKWFNLDTYPAVFCIPNIKKSLTLSDISYLFVFMKMLLKEGLQFDLINAPHCFWRDSYLISVLVGTF